MTEEPVACPSNFYCKAGYSLPESCAALFESERTSESCHPQAMLYLIMLGAVALLVIFVAVIVCVRTTKSSKPKPTTERDKLIPQPLDGPVYEGL
jgi:heme/copper-type cytochrome/quinol oxidase subunit 2